MNHFKKVVPMFILILMTVLVTTGLSDASAGEYETVDLLEMEFALPAADTSVVNKGSPKAKTVIRHTKLKDKIPEEINPSKQKERLVFVCLGS